MNSRIPNIWDIIKTPEYRRYAIQELTKFLKIMMRSPHSNYNKMIYSLGLHYFKNADQMMRLDGECPKNCDYNKMISEGTPLPEKMKKTKNCAKCFLIEKDLEDIYRIPQQSYIKSWVDGVRKEEKKYKEKYIVRQQIDVLKVTINFHVRKEYQDVIKSPLKTYWHRIVEGNEEIYFEGLYKEVQKRSKKTGAPYLDIIGYDGYREIPIGYIRTDELEGTYRKFKLDRRWAIRFTKRGLEKYIGPVIEEIFYSKI